MTIGDPFVTKGSDIIEFLKNLKDFLFAESVEDAKYVAKVEKELNRQVKSSVKFGFIYCL